MSTAFKYLTMIIIDSLVYISHSYLQAFLSDFLMCVRFCVNEEKESSLFEFDSDSLW